MSAALAPAPQPRGYHVPYRGDGTDICPGCGRRHFYVGRTLAECAFCGCALELPVARGRLGGAIVRGRSPRNA